MTNIPESSSKNIEVSKWWKEALLSAEVLAPPGEILIMNAWKAYLEIQEDTSDIPHLRNRMVLYVKEKWSLPTAWNDFHKIIERNKDEILWEAGRGKFNIPDFSYVGFTQNVFRRILYEMIFQITGKNPLDIPHFSQIAKLTELSKERVALIETFSAKSIQDIVTVPTSDFLNVPKWTVAHSTVLVHRSLYKWSSEDIVEMLEDQDWKEFGKTYFEAEIQRIIKAHLMQIESKYQVNGFENRILWFKSPNDLPIHHTGYVNYKLSVVTSDEIGKIFKYILTNVMSRRLLIHNLEEKLSDPRIKSLDVSVTIWTPFYGEERAFYRCKHGISIRVSEKPLSDGKPIQNIEPNAIER